MPQILKHCIITHQDSEVIRDYALALGSDTYHTGIDIKADTIYCPCQGVVIYSGLVDSKPSCTVQYSNNICLRFTHLQSLNVSAGNIIEADCAIGRADEFVHFEYLTSEQTYPNFRVFFNAQAYSYYMYKHDPYLVLLGNVHFEHRQYNTRKESAENYEARYNAFLEMQKINPAFFVNDNESYALFNSDLFDDLSGD